MKRISNSVYGQLRGAILRRRRKTVYRMLEKKHAGKVPCFCCGEHVPKDQATAEHIKPRSKGGTDDISNLAISHEACNQARGNAE
jgi:5-methylcytosine-specific restriction endonuclease McrA